jgi:hypothetical protein
VCKPSGDGFTVGLVPGVYAAVLHYTYLIPMMSKGLLKGLEDDCTRQALGHNIGLGT